MSAQVPTISIEQPATQQPLELCWSDLLKKFFEVLIGAGKGKQESNFKTAFKFFLISIGLTKESPVGAELGDEFEAKIEIYIKFQLSRGLKNPTYEPRVSKIRELKKFAEANFAQSLRFQTLPQTFSQKLRRLITSLGFTILSFWKTLPEGTVSYTTLRDWCGGKRYPSKKSLTVIQMVEEHLRAPVGTLLLSKYRSGDHHHKAGGSDSGNKTRAAMSKPYAVWTAALEEEFQGLFIHKTEAILPDGEERFYNGQWTAREGAGISTADIVRKFLRSFMGFCALPQDSPDVYLKGPGIKAEELSLALLADKGLVEAYLNFMRLRSGLRVKPVDESKAATLHTHSISANGRWEFYDKGGKYNRGSIQSLIYISGLLRPGTGYLYQHPEFAEKLGPRMTAENWHKQCVATRSRVDRLLREILLMKKNNNRENYDFGRDPKEPIEWILELNRPLLLLQEVLKEMLADLLPENAPKCALFNVK